MTADLLDDLAPGVRGYTLEENGELWIPRIVAAEPGSGQVAAYLDSLPKGVTICFPTVLSPRLQKMLERRGFRPEPRWCEEAVGWVEVFVRQGQPAGE